MVAVSGGSDSMALLYLANAWARQNKREIHAVSVDHGLRPEAAAEAAFVAMVCDGLDIVHTTLSWDGVKPQTGISAAARHARYQLMEEFANDIGVRIILSGHTADDQAETVLMRLGRSVWIDGSGNSEVEVLNSARGHSGMCRRTQLGGGALLMRPLLGLSRQDLREYLNEISQSWIEDPSNHDESYERVRIRKRLFMDDKFKTRLYQYAGVMGRMRQVVAQDASNLLRQCCNCEPGHVFVISYAQLKAAPQQVGTMALKSVVAVAGGNSHLISDGQAHQIWQLCNQPKEGRITLGGCIIEWANAQLSIFREVRNLHPAVVEDSQTLLWDGRVHITNDSDGTVHIGPMADKFSSEFIDNAGDKFAALRKAVLLSSPVITTYEGVDVPIYFNKSSLPAQVDIRTGARALELFCPEWEFSLLEWLLSIDLATDQRNHSAIDGNDATEGKKDAR